MVQTCVVACSSLAFAGGFGCYLLSMDAQSFRNAGNIPGNRAEVCPKPSSARRSCPAQPGSPAAVCLVLRCAWAGRMPQRNLACRFKH